MRFIYNKIFIIFFSCLVCAILLGFLEVKGYSQPVKTVFLNAPRPVAAVAKTIAKPVKNFFLTLYRLKKINQDNTALAAQVHDLQQQLVDYNQATRENQILKQELGFVSTSKHKLVPCTVLEQNPLGLTDTLVANCGQNEGISQGQGVVSQGYLVGKIVYAGKNSSTILLITSSQFSADARLSKSGSSGVVEGSFGSGIILNQLSQNDQASKGDLVVTAGINPQIPQNILIGQVGNVLSGKNDVFKKASVISPVDFSNLEFVFAVQ